MADGNAYVLPISILYFLSNKFFAGEDVTLIGWGTQVHVLLEVAQMAKAQFKAKCEVIDLVSVLPWDRQTLIQVFIIKINIFFYIFSARDC